MERSSKNTCEDYAWVGAFLLVIPGCLIMGAGIGLALNELLAGALVGFGAGLLAWGLIVSFRRK